MTSRSSSAGWVAATTHRCHSRQALCRLLTIPAITSELGCCACRATSVATWRFVMPAPNTTTTTTMARSNSCGRAPQFVPFRCRIACSPQEVRTVLCGSSASPFCATAAAPSPSVASCCADCPRLVERSNASRSHLPKRATTWRSDAVEEAVEVLAGPRAAGWLCGRSSARSRSPKSGRSLTKTTLTTTTTVATMAAMAAMEVVAT